MMGCIWPILTTCDTVPSAGGKTAQAANFPPALLGFPTIAKSQPTRMQRSRNQPPASGSPQIAKGIERSQQISPNGKYTSCIGRHLPADASQHTKNNKSSG